MIKRALLKSCILVFLICLFLTFACGCSYSGYKGEYPGAYTLVYTQVPDTRGARFLGPNYDDPQIILLETDSQGRGLYLYLEDTEGPLSLVIVQRESEEMVYFYPEDSAISFRTPDRIYDLYERKLPDSELISLYQELCSTETLANFKAENDWDNPIDESRLDSAAITKPTLPNSWSYRSGKVSLSSWDWRELMLSLAVKNGHNVPEGFLNGNDGMNIYDSYMATDKYGRELHYIESCYYVYTEEGVYPSGYTRYYLEMIAIINPDGSYDPDNFMIELADKCDPDDDIRELKERCGWNQPLDGEVGK